MWPEYMRAETLANIIAIDDVHARIPPAVRPSLRHVREAMVRGGFARKFGKRYVTSPELAEAYIRGILCETERSEGPSSHTGARRKGSGSRADGCLSVKQTAALPGSELSEALAVLREARAKHSVTSSTGSTKSAHPPSRGR